MACGVETECLPQVQSMGSTAACHRQQMHCKVWQWLQFTQLKIRYTNNEFTKSTDFCFPPQKADPLFSSGSPQKWTILPWQHTSHIWTMCVHHRFGQSLWMNVTVPMFGLQWNWALYLSDSTVGFLMAGFICHWGRMLFCPDYSA